MHAGYEHEPGLFRMDNPRDIVLRKYQEESVEELRANFRKGVKAQILASMTGSGKTVMGAYLLRECWRKGRNGIFIVDRDNLLGQTSKLFDSYGIPHGVIQGGHARWRPSEQIQIAMIQTIARRGWPKADLIVNDESHFLYKTMTDKINREDTKVIGLTATPFTRGMGRFYNAIVNVRTANQLTAEGYLCPFKVWAPKEPDMKGVKVVNGEWEENETAKRAAKIVGDVVKEYLAVEGMKKAICFGVNVAHCEELQAKFLRAGVNAQLYCYQTPDEEKDMILDEFRKPDSTIRVLISVAALSRGFDVEDIEILLACRPLKNSFSEFIQTLGRVLRPSPGKPFARILDLAGNFMRHYPAMVEFFEEGAQTLDDGKPKPKAATPEKKERKPVKCPECSHVFAGGKFCPSCGYQFRAASDIKHAAGTLDTFDGSHVLKMDREQKRKLWSELAGICQKRKYKPGWIGWMYKRILGVWPQGVMGPASEPSEATLAAVRRLATRRPQKPATVILGAGRAELDLFA